MKRRNFISILAGIAASIPFVGMLVKKPEDALTLDKFEKISDQIKNWRRDRLWFEEMSDKIYYSALPSDKEYVKSIQDWW